MTLSGSDTLLYTLAFLVPGFIIDWVLSAFAAPRKQDSQILLLRFLTLSCANYALWSLPIYYSITTRLPQTHPFGAALLYAVVVLFSPIVLGVLIGGALKSPIPRRMLFRLGFNTLHAVPTSWQYKFGSVKRGVWIVVTLTEGSQIAGVWGVRSFASSDSECRDLYIERVYKIGDTGQWNAVERSDGVFIAKDQVKTIEFFEIQGD